MHWQFLRLVVEETVSSKGRVEIHDEVMYRAVSGVDEVCLYLEQVVDALDDISLVYEDFVP